MSVKQVKIDIQGDEYTFNTFPATKGLAYLTKLLKIVGPAFGKLTAGNEPVAGEEDVSFSQAVEILVENLYKEDVTALVKAMTSGVTKNGMQLEFDQDFAGNYGVMLQILVAIIKENYSSFFTGNGISDIIGVIPGLTQS